MTERWLLLAYSCSGFAGLVYEIAWTRLLTLHLGHATAAVSTVTAAFMGGLGLGGALGGCFASRLSRRQALWGAYALLELVVADATLTIAWSLKLLTPAFAWAYREDSIRGTSLPTSTSRNWKWPPARETPRPPVRGSALAGSELGPGARRACASETRAMS